MIRPFVIDKERNLTQVNDLLGTSCYAHQLTDAIRNVPEEQSYTIGLYGTWGSGKSTIIETSKQQLEDVKNKKYKVVVYDAWKYSGDSFRRMFLLQLLSDLKLTETEDMKQFYEATTEETKPQVKLKYRGVVIALLIILFLSLLLLILYVYDKIDSLFSISMVISLGTLIVTLCGGLFYELKVIQTRNVLFAPEQFEECFRQMMESVLRKKSWYVKVYKWVKNFIFKSEEVYDLDKLIIVIDNLDRCDTDVVYSMLTDIKTFLDCEHYDVVFVIPVDHEALKKHLFAKRDVQQINSDDEDSWVDAEEFLRKFFNVVIRIKKHRPDDLLHYVNELNIQNKLGCNPNTLSLIAKVYAENPRRMLQMINNLTVEQALYDEPYAKEHETLIAACMIIREKYDQLIESLIASPDFVYDEALYEVSEQEHFPIELRMDSQFHAFMRLAKYTLQRANHKDIRYILTNTSHALSNLSNEILDILDNYDFSKILPFIKNESTHDDVFMEICRRIRIYNATNSSDDMVLMLEILARINDVAPLRTDELEKLNEGLTQIYTLVPLQVSYSNEICSLAKNMAKIGEYQLKQCLKKYIEDFEKVSEKLYHSYVRSMLSTFTDKVECESFSSFAENYFYQIGDVKTFSFTEDQKTHLFTSNYIDKIINDMTDRTKERQRDLLVWCFDNLNNIKNAALDVLFSRLKNVVGQTLRKPLAEYLSDIAFMMPILKSINKEIMSDSLKQLFSIITDARQLANGTSATISSEVNDSNAKELAEFCFELYRISGRQLSINPCLITIQNKCEEYVKNQLIEKMSIGWDMLPFKKNILAFITIDESWYKLIPIAFVQEAKTEDMVLKEKIQILYQNRVNETALKLLVDITADEHLNKLFIDLLDVKNYENLNQLPEVLLPRLLNLYTEENANQFENNNAMLRIVLENGKPNQRKLVRKTLIDRINKDLDLDGVLDLISSVKIWTLSDKKSLGGLLQSKLPEPNVDIDEPMTLSETQRRIKDVIDKYLVY